MIKSNRKSEWNEHLICLIVFQDSNALYFHSIEAKKKPQLECGIEMVDWPAAKFNLLNFGDTAKSSQLK